MKHTVTEKVLKNGLKGLVIDIPDAPVVSLEIGFRAGEFLLERRKWETAHIMEHLMLGANNSYTTSRAFQAELEKNGAYSNASTSAYDITYDVECAAFEAERVIDLVVRALEKPHFLPAEFEAEFGNVAEELVGRSNNHFRTLNLAIREAQGLYSVGDLERHELMKNVTVQDVAEHYTSTHTINNARFLLAGKITPACLTLLEGLKLPKGEGRVSLPLEHPKQLDGPLFLHRKDVPNLYFYIDTYAPALLDEPSRDALAVTSTILTETLHSKLLGTARARGLVYAMGSGQQHLKDRSSFWLGAQVSLQNANALFTLITEVLNETKRKGVTVKELEAAKLYMRGKHERSAQTATGTLAAYNGAYYYDDSIEKEEAFQQRIEAVTSQKIADTLTAVTSGVWTLGILGSCKQEVADDLHNVLSPLFAN